MYMIFPLFLLFNAVKIALYNYFMILDKSYEILLYKLAISLLLAIAAFPLIYRLKSRVVLIVAYTLQSIYIIANMSYYAYFHSYLHVMQSMALFSEAFTLARKLAVPLNANMFIAFIDLPLLIYLVMKIRSTKPLANKRRSMAGIAAILSAVLLFSIEIYHYSHNQSVIQIIHDTYSGESPIVKKYGTVVNNITNIFLSSGSKELAEQLQYGSEQANTAPSAVKPNFVIIQVESMDSSVIDQKHKGSYIAPYLHSLSRKSIYYPYVLSYHKGGGTSDSEFSIINSVEPLDEYPALKLSNYQYPNSMIRRFEQASYRTLAFHGNAGGFYNRDVAFPRLGFDAFYDMSRMKIPENGWGLPDNEVFNYAVDTMKDAGQPFFSFIITMTNHEPFDSASNYYNNNMYDDIKDDMVKNFFNSIGYVDMSLKNIIESMEANFENTYIIILGDHTPNIDTLLYRQASFTMDGRYFEFVPLIIITPDKKVYREKKEVASFLDIAPTVLRASGISFIIRSDGKDLINPDKNAGKIPLKGRSYSRTLLFEKAFKR